MVRLAEWGIVVALAAHLAGGLRVLVLEFLPWQGWQKALAAAAAGFAARDRARAGACAVE